jgi:hypothetical protein
LQTLVFGYAALRETLSILMINRPHFKIRLVIIFSLLTPGRVHRFVSMQADMVEKSFCGFIKTRFDS